MGTKKGFKVLLPVLAILWGGESFALGMGFTAGTADEEWSNYNGAATEDYEVSNFGFVLDTNVARNKLFNYRFALMQEENKKSGGGVMYEGISMTHDFGFALFKNQHVRLWLGPRLKTAFYDTISDNNFSSSNDVFGIAVGPVLGVNVHVKDIVSFSLTTGILRGEYDDYYYDSNTTSFSSGVDSSSSFLNMSVIFRIRDNY